MLKKKKTIIFLFSGEIGYFEVVIFRVFVDSISDDETRSDILKIPGKKRGGSKKTNFSIIS